MDRPTVGFISAPAWFDPAPSEFPTVIDGLVRTQQAPLLLPEFDYRLDSIARVQGDLNLCAHSLKSMGCDVAAQVGSPFSWARTKSESEARGRCDAMAAAAGLPVIMTGLAIIDGLKAIGANHVAVDCTYYETDWRDAFAAFLTCCGFHLDHVSTLSDQGLADADAKMADLGWSMTHDMTRRSILSVSDAAPNADAIVVTGAGTRTLGILSEMESRTGRPIVAADTIVYWAIARELGLSLQPSMGSWVALTM